LLQALTEVNSPALAERPILYTFFDFNGATGVDITATEIRGAADLSVIASRYQSDGRVVAIYAKSDLTFALARMWQILVGETGWETHVFRDRSEAVKWVCERVALRFNVQVAIDT